MSASKARWRRWAKRVRSALPLSCLSREVAESLRAWPLFQAAEHVLTYSAFGSELDLRPLQEDGAKTFYLTRTWGPGEALTVHPVAGGLERHPAGYLQPAADTPQVSPELVDLVLVPGLCFDRRGTRLGYGGGFYDRLLPGLRPGTPRVGVTVQALVVPDLPEDAFDVAMTHLATEVDVAEVAL